VAIGLGAYNYQQYYSVKEDFDQKCAEYKQLTGQDWSASKERQAEVRNEYLATFALTGVGILAGTAVEVLQHVGVDTLHHGLQLLHTKDMAHLSAHKLRYVALGLHHVASYLGKSYKDKEHN